MSRKKKFVVEIDEKYVDKKKHQMVTYIIGKAYGKKFLRHNIKKKLSDVDRQKKSLFSTGGKKINLQATKTLAPPPPDIKWCVPNQLLKINYALNPETLNPLNPYDASRHHFASLKNDLLSWKLSISEKKISRKCLLITIYLFHFSPTSNHLLLPQVENCESNSRLVVDEDDKGKFRLERVKYVGT